jgi:UPF0716 protein FxsA
MTPRFALVVILLGLPLVEIYLFIKVSSAIGLLPTLALMILICLAGAALMREQGGATLRRARESLARDEMPAYELMEGVALLLGGALLLVPGFLTDVLGFLCLWPTSRRLLLRALIPHIQVTDDVRAQRPAHGRVIEGEYTRKPDR